MISNKQISNKERCKKVKGKSKKTNTHSLKFLPTSKIVLLAVILYCMHLTYFFEKTIDKMIAYSADYSSIGNVLISFIGILATLITTVVGYFIKSTKENTKDGIVYELAIRETEEVTEACG